MGVAHVSVYDLMHFHRVVRTNSASLVLQPSATPKAPVSARQAALRTDGREIPVVLLHIIFQTPYKADPANFFRECPIRQFRASHLRGQSDCLDPLWTPIATVYEIAVNTVGSF